MTTPSFGRFVGLLALACAGISAAPASAQPSKNDLLRIGATGTLTAKPDDMIQSKSSKEGSGDANVGVTPADAITVTFSPIGNVIDNADGTPRLTRVDVTYPNTVCTSEAGGTMRCLRVVISLPSVS